MFLKKKIGALLILIICSFSFENRLYSQEANLKLLDLRQLAKQFYDENKYFLSYIYNLSFYHLTIDPAEKIKAGLDALDSCLMDNRFQEAEELIYKLEINSPQLKEYMTYKCGYSLLMSGRFADGDIYLTKLQQSEKLLTKIQFLRAYAKLNLNQPKECIEYLNKIKDEEFPHMDELNEIKHDLATGAKGGKKNKLVAFGLSAFIPGAGQAYSGLYFDAIQDFGFNLVLGYSAYASWRYELTYERGDRNYTMPLISTVVWGIFYLTNLHNAVNSANKANLYRENTYYTNILKKFQLVIKDKDYFLLSGKLSF